MFNTSIIKQIDIKQRDTESEKCICLFHRISMTIVQSDFANETIH